MKLALARAGVMFSAVFILFYIAMIKDESWTGSFWESIQTLTFVALLFSVPVFFIGWYFYEWAEMKLRKAKQRKELRELRELEEADKKRRDDAVAK